MSFCLHEVCFLHLCIPVYVCFWNLASACPQLLLLISIFLVFLTFFSHLHIMASDLADIICYVRQLQHIAGMRLEMFIIHDTSNLAGVLVAFLGGVGGGVSVFTCEICVEQMLLWINHNWSLTAKLSGWLLASIGSFFSLMSVNFLYGVAAQSSLRHHFLQEPAGKLADLRPQGKSSG